MNPFHSPFGLLSKNWLIWRLGRRHVASVAHLAHGRTIDIGCGEQPFRSVFDGHVSRIWGFEHKKTLHPNPSIEIYGSALDLPFRDAAFDTALCFQVLEHVPEPLRLIEEARRVLRPGSHLILTAPHIWNVHEMPHDYFRFTCYGLTHLLDKAGFEVVEVRPMAGYFVTAAARFSYFLAHFDHWGLQILVRPAFFVVQCIGGLMDRIYCDKTETWNYLAVGRVPRGADSAAPAI